MALTTTTATRVTTTKPATTTTSRCSRCSNGGSWGSTMMGLTTTTMRVRHIDEESRWTTRKANGEDGWRKMYVFFGIVFFISYIFVLLQQEEDGAVAITLKRRA